MGVPISNVTRRVVYEASGTGPYSFSFEILANTDIAVYKDDALLTLTTDYTVTINSNGTGSVTLIASPTGADQIAIVGNRTIQRTTDFVTGGDFFANTVNDEMDQQTIFAQQNAEGLSRTLQAPQTDPTSINMTLPRASLRAGKNLAFDADGNPALGDTVGTNRGNWAAGTLYYVRDIVKDTSNSNIWQCLVQHTSTGSQPISTNTDAAKWSLLVDAASAATSASNAASSASAAATSATNAASSATASASSASSASTSASTATTKASEAATSATGAASSASSASSSASTASTKASEASTSATNAASSASSASTSASNASTSATSASTSASNASTSATNAASSASSASTSASNASTSATNASNSATAAATSATNASNSATAAATSATNAANSATAAAASAAEAATFDPDLFLAKSGNLSGLASTSTARTNLGVAIGTDVQAYSAELQGIAQGGNIGMKNRIINGAMVIDQRNAGASITPSTNGTMSLDRWKCGLNTGLAASKYSVQQSSTAPAGFSNSVLITSTSAYTVQADDYSTFTQAIEGFNFADFGFGTANAQPLTISFQIRSSLTGTFAGFIQNNNADRSYPFTFTISAANTWESKTVTIAGDTTGTWVGATNGTGLLMGFNLGTGSNRQGTANTWSAGNYRTVSGAVNLIATNAATFYITGVQLEKGSTATSFDFRSYGTELALCQRYYWSIGRLPFTGNTNYTHIGAGTARSSTAGYIIVPYPVTMRSAPSLSVVGATTFNIGQGGFTTTTVAADVLGVNTASIDLAWAAGGTFSLNSACRLYTGTSNAELQFSAEL